MKKLIAAMATAGLLVAGTAGIAGAVEPPDPKAPAATADAKARRTDALKVAARTIGIERKALVTALREGESIADVARANDVEPEAVVDAVLAATNAKIDAAVDAGKIDADHAATMKERAPDRIARLVNSEQAGRHRAERASHRRHARRAGFAIAADVIGIERQALRAALRAALRGGQSIAEVAGANDVEPQAVIDAVVNAASTRIDKAVDAERIDADRADALKKRLADRVAKRVNAEPRKRHTGS